MSKPTRRPLVGLLLSTVLSVSGNGMAFVLIPWLVLRRTGNAAYAGLINSGALVAGIASLVFSAAVIDRWKRRNLSVGADLLSAAAVLAIPVIDWAFGLTTATIAVLVIVGALFDAPGRSAREALRPDIARRSGVSLERTNALGEVCDGIGGIAGPAVAGIAVASIGLFASFWLAASFLGLAGLVFWIAEPATEIERADEDDEAFLRAAAAGFRRVWSDPVLRDTAISGALFGLALAPIVLVFTAAFEAQDRASELGGFFAAFSVGTVVGASGYAWIGERLRRRPVLLASLAGASVGIALLAVVLENYPALVAAAVFTGVTAGPAGPIFSVIIQQRAEDSVRGRVLATIGTIELVTAPLALVIAGLVIEATSPRTTLVVVAICTTLAAIFTATAPGLRRIEPHQLD